MVDSLAGNLLVASTLVHDPVCANSVCLVVHHDADGAIGVMLNRPLVPNPAALLALLGQKDEPEPRPSKSRMGSKTETGISKLPNPLPSPPSATSNTVHFGGPLSGPVVAIHSSSEFAEAETGPGIYVAAQKEHLEELVNKAHGPMRLIVGHLGWPNDQLQNELAAGIWHVLPATVEAVFTSDQDMWPRLIRRATARSLAAWIETTDHPRAWDLN